MIEQKRPFSPNQLSLADHKPTRPVQEICVVQIGFVTRTKSRQNIQAFWARSLPPCCCKAAFRRPFASWSLINFSLV